MSEYARVLGKGPVGVEIDLNDVSKEYVNVFWGLKPEEQPLRPEGIAITKQRVGHKGPTSRCLPAGVPGATFVYAFKIVQAPREIVILLGSGDPSRQIYTDGRGLPQDPQPSWMGYSAGKWEGDTLAVESTGFTEDSWLDGSGHPRSESMRIRELYHRRDFGHMDLEVTIDDPKYYTRPFTLKTQLNLIPDSDVIEFVCSENEKDPGAPAAAVIAVLLACVFGFLSRDAGSATAMGIFGSGWIALAISFLLAGPNAKTPSLGIFMIMDALAVLSLAIVAISGKPLLSILLFFAAARFLLTSIVQFGAAPVLNIPAGVLGLITGAFALYGGLALLLEDVKQRTVLPMFRRGPARQSIEGSLQDQLEHLEHEAGVRQQL